VPSPRPSLRATYLRRLNVRQDTDRRLAELGHALEARSDRIDERLADLEGLLKKVQTSVARATPRWGPGAEPVALDYPRTAIYLAPTTKLARNRSRACAKEPFTVEWIERSLQPGDVLYDIGANVGAYALIAGRQASGDVRVYAFEPAYATYATLCDNIVLNQADEIVHPLQVLLGARTEVTAIHLRDRRAGAAQHEDHDEQSGDGAHVASQYRQPVLAYRLDDLIRDGLPTPNHVKLDVDGAELSVLEGAPQALSDPALRSLMIEVAERDATSIGELLGEHGLVENARHERAEDPAGRAGFWYAEFVRGAGTSER
jgi:FkbM family methyltransferase